MHLHPNIKKIAIVGTSGAGKSTFARALGLKTGLPVYHMDSLYWKPNWTEVPEEEWKKQESLILAKDSWIIEGWIDGAHPERLQQADLIVDLDLNGILCAWNGLKRWRFHRHKSRPELAAGCCDKLNLSFLWTMLTKKERKEIEDGLARAGNAPVVKLSSTASIEEFLNDFAAAING